MRENPVGTKSEAFALRIVKLYKFLKLHREDVLSRQVLRSGTSIGANVAEAQYAQSRADFVMKMSIALKEASETRYWLKLLVNAGYLPDDDATTSIVADCNELIRLLTSTVKTTKGS